jgi:hypothetical protein
MDEPVSRARVEAFITVYAVRDAEKIAAFLDDDVHWKISGPVDVLPYCGSHRGKAAVLDLIGRQIPAVMRVFHFAPEVLLIDGNNTATLSRLSARRTLDNRIISYRIANFFRFKNDKLIANFSLLDSFDAAEQVLGHPLAVHDESSDDIGDIVTV